EHGGRELPAGIAVDAGGVHEPRSGDIRGMAEARVGHAEAHSIIGDNCYAAGNRGALHAPPPTRAQPHRPGCRPGRRPASRPGRRREGAAAGPALPVRARRGLDRPPRILGEPARARRPPRRLDVRLQQLPGHHAVAEGRAAEVRGQGALARRRPHPGDDLRAGEAESGSGSEAPGPRLPAPARQRFRVLERPRRPGLADGVPGRPLRPAARPSHRRGAFRRGQRTPGRSADRGTAGGAGGRLRRRGRGDPPMIFGPTFAEMRDPSRIPADLREKARAARSRPLDPLNLYNLSWKADGRVPFTVLPEALTGVWAPIVVLSGRKFPTGSHKVGPAYSILAEKQVEGQCVPGDHTLVFPSTGNFGIGGAWVGPRMGYRSGVVLPEDMSEER